MITRDDESYARLLSAMASLSGLFSDNTSPYIDSRFVERLFAATTGGLDLGREDCSFDVLLDGRIGVGIKTFLGGMGNSKTEKVAEFTALARKGLFNVRDKRKLVERVTESRNSRILSDVAEYGIDLDNCIYHCLIRLPNAALVHEEPYRLIDIANIRPTNSHGVGISEWGEISSGVHFTDGRSRYTFNISKNVLFKRFEFDRHQPLIPLSIHQNPLDILLKIVAEGSKPKTLAVAVDFGRSNGATDVLIAGVDYVVLPLYSVRNGEVAEKSGINQWNAGGRARTFGEAYVSIPAEIHRRFPGFFPNRDTHFGLSLPNSNVVHQAKVCQDGGKALMTDPNFELGRWLIGVIDPSIPAKDFNGPVKGRQPFEYSDLVAIGKDSVRITKVQGELGSSYRAEFAPLGSYRDFIET